MTPATTSKTVNGKNEASAADGAVVGIGAAPPSVFACIGAEPSGWFSGKNKATAPAINKADTTARNGANNSLVFKYGTYPK